MDEQQTYQTYNEEIEIDIKDLLCYVFKHIKTCILCILIGALFGGGIYVYKLHTENNAGESIVEPSDDAKENMDLAYQYRTMYQNQLTYNQESILMNLNAGDAYQGKLRYYVSAGKNSDYLMAKYNALLLDNALWDDIKTASGLDTEVKYLKELIDVEAYTSITKDDTSIDSAEDNELKTDLNGFVIDVTVNMPDDTSCQDVMDVIDAAILNINSQSDSDYSFTLLANDVSALDTADLHEMQESSYTALSNYSTQYKNLENSFSTDEKNYYEINYLDLEEEQEVSISPKKYLVIGVVAGIFLWGCFYVLKYILDKSVKTVDEGKNAYYLNLIGSLSLKDKNPDSKEYLIASISQLPEKKILLSVDAKEAETLAPSLKDACNNIVATGTLRKDGKLLQKVEELDGVILVIVIKKTKHTEVQRELEVCALHNVPVLGYVAIVE